MRMAALAVVAANLKAHMRHLLLRKTTLPDKSSVRSRCELQHHPLDPSPEHGAECIDTSASKAQIGRIGDPDGGFAASAAMESESQLAKFRFFREIRPDCAFRPSLGLQ
jgi:hypothetical protein